MNQNCPDCDQQWAECNCRKTASTTDSPRSPEGVPPSSGESVSIPAYYQFPEGCRDLMDLIERKGYGFAKGCMLKYAMRAGEKLPAPCISTAAGQRAEILDLMKLIDCAQRRIEVLRGS